MLMNTTNNDFENSVLKYTGFSLSKGLEEIDHVMKTKIGTPRYMAPVI
jgi:serine/threonine protein kinase